MRVEFISQYIYQGTQYNEHRYYVEKQAYKEHIGLVFLIITFWLRLLFFGLLLSD